MKVKVNWETDGEDVDLPKVVDVPEKITEDEVSDYLSDTYGWLVNSWHEVEDFEVPRENNQNEVG